MQNLFLYLEAMLIIHWEIPFVFILGTSTISGCIIPEFLLIFNIIVLPKPCKVETYNSISHIENEYVELRFLCPEYTKVYRPK